MEEEGGPPEHEAVAGDGEAADDRLLRLATAIDLVSDGLGGGVLSDQEQAVIRALHGGFS
jgi:hypothetical protein